VTYSEHDLQRLVDRELGGYLDTGREVRNVEAWRASCRKRIQENERSFTGFIERSVRGMDAAARGQRVTCCVEVRGSHGMSHDYDPAGIDPAPGWWSLDLAKREANHRRRALGLAEFP
jgi:hypothetical protein